MSIVRKNGEIKTPKEYKERYKKFYGLLMELKSPSPKIKNMRKVDVSIDEIRDILEKEYPYYVHVVYTVCRVRIQRRSNWEDFTGGFLFLLDSYDNVHLGFIDAFPKEGNYSVNYMFNLFDNKEQIAKLEDFEGNAVIFRTLKSNYCVEFPKLYPKGDFMGQYNKIIELRGPYLTSTKKPKKKNNGLSSSFIPRLSGKFKLSTPPPKIKKMEVIGIGEAKKIKKELSEEMKFYLRKTLGFKVLKPTKKEGIRNLNLIDDALKGYTVLMKEMNCLLDGKNFMRVPPKVGSLDDKNFKEVLRNTRNKEKLEILGGGF